VQGRVAAAFRAQTGVIAEDVYRTPDERFRDLDGYPFTARYLQVHGMRMHYVDEGSGDPVLMLHGEPTWSYLYRKMIPAIAAKHRAVVPDYIGFGKSDKWIDDANYTFASHYNALEAFVGALGLRGITLVMQDWGGPLGLRLATQHPERIARLVIMNTGLFSGHPGTISSGLQQWRDNSQRVIEALSPGEILRRSMRATELSEEVVRGYDAPFPNRESKAGPRRFPLMIPQCPDDPGGREMKETREALATWDKPTLVMFSDGDVVFPPAEAERFVESIPNAEGPKIIAGPGHFLQEEAGEQLAEEILAFVGRH
jgi:haloalkane dehalogenase